MYNFKKEYLKLKLYKYRIRKVLKEDEKAVLERNVNCNKGR